MPASFWISRRVLIDEGLEERIFSMCEILCEEGQQPGAVWVYEIFFRPRLCRVNERRQISKRRMETPPVRGREVPPIDAGVIGEIRAGKKGLEIEERIFERLRAREFTWLRSVWLDLGGEAERKAGRQNFSRFVQPVE